MATNGHATQPLRIAIIGAGLVGVTAALTFRRLPNAEITVYERAPGPHETGAWIAMNVSGLRILDQLLPDYAELQGIIYQGASGITHRHWRSGETLAVSNSPHTAERFREGRTHRVPLHNLLLSHLPEGQVQYGREVDRVRVNDGAGTAARKTATLVFVDGKEAEVDLVVAADGIYSKLRRQYLPDSIPKYRGSVAYRHVFPETLVQHIKDLPEGTSSWQNDFGEIAYMSKVGLGKYGIVAIVNEPEEKAAELRWGHALGAPGVQRLREHFKDWHPVVRQAVDALPGIDGYRLETAPWLENLTRDDVVAFIGDAAHPTAGAYGAGATFGYCDAWALYRFLEASSPRDKTRLPDIPRALAMFNHVRQPFLARVERQLALDGRNAKYVAAAKADEAEWSRRWQEKFSLQWWMLEHDVEAECQRLETEAVFAEKDGDGVPVLLPGDVPIGKIASWKL